jgi:hypothetical protein
VRSEPVTTGKTYWQVDGSETVRELIKKLNAAIDDICDGSGAIVGMIDRLVGTIDGHRTLEHDDWTDEEPVVMGHRSNDIV